MASTTLEGDVSVKQMFNNIYTKLKRLTKLLKALVVFFIKTPVLVKAHVVPFVKAHGVSFLKVLAAMLATTLGGLVVVFSGLWLSFDMVESPRLQDMLTWVSGSMFVGMFVYMSMLSGEYARLEKYFAATVLGLNSGGGGQKKPV